MADQIKKRKKTRAGHKGYVAKLLADVETSMAEVHGGNEAEIYAVQNFARDAGRGADDPRQGNLRTVRRKRGSDG